MDEKQGRGLVNCSVYRDNQKVGSVDIEAISDALNEDDTFVWVGLVEPDAALMREVQDEFGLPEIAVAEAQVIHQRPKIDEYGDTLLVILHTAMQAGDAILYGETRIFLGKRFVVTVRYGPSLGYASIRQRIESMPNRLAQGPGYILSAIIDAVVDQYQYCMAHLQTRFREVEQQLFVPQPQSDSLQAFYQLKTEIMKLASAAAPLDAICNQLLRFHTEMIPKNSRLYYRDILENVARVTHTCADMREMINAAMQVSLAQVTIRQNEMVKRLAGWGAILAVPTMVFSMYGMNFEFMPELKWRGSYPLVMAAILLGCVLLHRRLKKNGWL